MEFASLICIVSANPSHMHVVNLRDNLTIHSADESWSSPDLQIKVGDWCSVENRPGVIGSFLSVWELCKCACQACYTQRPCLSIFKTLELNTNCMQQAKAWDKAREAHEMAASCWRHQGSPWHAAKHLEKAGDCARESSDMTLMIDYMKQASSAYREAGRPQAAADCLTKGAKWSEASNPEVCLSTVSCRR